MVFRSSGDDAHEGGHEGPWVPEFGTSFLVVWAAVSAHCLPEEG